MKRQLFYSKKHSRLLLVAILLCINVMALRAQQWTYHVSTTGDDTNDGQSWVTPLRNLQTALSLAVPGDQIWVAQGTYYPDEGLGQTNDDRNSTFMLKDGVHIYGGFVGINSALSPRDPSKYITILSGDLDQNDGASPFGNNSYHVVTGANAVILDGVTITAGFADGLGTNENKGGGILNASASPIIRNCILRGNIANSGGGIYNLSASPVISNTLFIDNSSSFGGAAYNDNASATFIDCTFQKNSSPQGGAIYNTTGTSANEFINTLISGNSSSQKGSGIYNIDAPLTLVNTTISGNKADVEAGGIYFEDSNSVNIQNSIIWNNMANNLSSTASATLTQTNSTITFAKCLVENYTPESQGGTVGVISNGDPLFIKNQMPSSAPSDGGDFRLHVNSPVLDIGDNTFNNQNLDILGNVRIQNSTIDLGAYEGGYSRIYFVSTTGNDSEDGLSWSKSIRNLQTAIMRATNGDKIWVAKGTYYPDEGAGQTSEDRTSRFTLKEEVAIYGGFSGNEKKLSDRNISFNETILSGDLDQNDTSGSLTGDNAYHVVVNGDGYTKQTILSGFTVTNGLANGASLDQKKGGGIYIVDGDLTISQCKIISNEAMNDGGGIYIESALPSITSCNIIGNTAASGGGIYNVFDAAPEITGCTFSGNTAASGAGAFNIQALPKYVNCSFYNNTATGSGGGILNDLSSPEILNTKVQGNSAMSGGGIYNINSASPILTNCLITGNKATTGGGMDSSVSSGPTLINCTVSGNQSSSDGGGLFNDNCTVTIKNTIIWNNEANSSNGTASASISENNGSTSSFTTSLVANFNMQSGIIASGDPSFVSQVNPITAPNNTGNFHLLTGSIAINVGDNAENPESNDLGGNTRIQNGTIDLGAYEGGTTVSVWTGTVDTDWNTPGNWTNGVPSGSLSVTIPNTTNKPEISMNTSAEVFDMSVQSGGELTLGGTSSLTVFRDLTVIGQLIVNSGGSIIVQGNSLGDIIYKRALNSTNGYLISSPVKDQDIDAFASMHALANGPTANDRELRTFNILSQTWDYYQNGSTNSGNFAQGEGKRIQLISASDLTFTGEIPQLNVAISTSALGNGINLLGNPYPSSIPANAAANSGLNLISYNTTTLAEQTIWLWNSTTSSYDAINQTSPPRFISPAQGFFVLTFANSVFDFTELMQSHQTDNFQRSTSNSSEITLTLEDGTSTSNTQVIYRNGTTTGFDNGMDSSLFEIEPSSFGIFTQLVENNFGRNIAIQSLPDADYENMVIPVGVRASNGATITISASTIDIPPGYGVYLEDKDANTFTSIGGAGESFSTTLSTALNGIGRFYLHVSNTLSTDDFEAHTVNMYLYQQNYLKIHGVTDQNARVKIYTILGREIHNISFRGSGVDEIPLPNMKDGLYIIHLLMNEGRVVKKVIKH